MYSVFFVPLSPLRITGYVSLLAACLGFNSTPCFAQPIFLTVSSTPYDRQMIPVLRVLHFPVARRTGQTSVTIVNEWMFNLRAIPYQYSSQWKTPAEVNCALVADCKGKAVMLYVKMRANGATGVRFIIGKHQVADLKTHAWLEWNTTSGTYVLDPTFNSAVERTEEHDPATYIARYAYNGSRKYRARYYRSYHGAAVAQN